MTAFSILGPADLKAFLETHQIQGELLHLNNPTPTVETAAVAVGAQPEQIVKSILFLVDGQPVLAITCGTSYVERRAISLRFGVGRKKVKLAAPETVAEETGFLVGAMPPFGHRQPLRTLIDPRVLEKPVVYAGGGSDYDLLRLDPRTILQVTQGEVLDLITPPGSEADRVDA
jgi:prolyl-tRNA editing enzyme YbaK/EbsC (Cys-tRNA(Pro) deacylase)